MWLIGTFGKKPQVRTKVIKTAYQIDVTIHVEYHLGHGVIYVILICRHVETWAACEWPCLSILTRGHFQSSHGGESTIYWWGTRQVYECRTFSKIFPGIS